MTKQRLTLIICLFTLFLSLLSTSKLLSQPKILVVLPNQFGANTHFNIDNLDEYGFLVTTAGITKTVQPCSWSRGKGNTAFEVDTLIDEITDITSYDAVAIMPMNWQSVSNPYADLINSAHFTELLQEAKNQNKVIWATCAGVRVLAKAGILDGVTVSGRDNYSSEYIAGGATYIGPNIPPVCDQNIITSTRGMYYMQENIDIISTALEKSGLDFSGNAEDLTLNNGNDEIEISLWSDLSENNGSKGFRDICSAEDGGFIAVGYTWQSSGNNSDILIAKFDALGNKVWHKTYGGPGWEYAWSVIPTMDNGFAITGYTSSTVDQNKNIYLIKLNQDGDLQWDKQIGGSGLEIGRDLVENNEGRITVVGYTESMGAGENDIMLARLSNTGDVDWIKLFGGAGPEIPRTLIINNAQEYMIAGETGSTDTGNRDFWIANVDEDGQLIWEKTYHKDNYDSGHQIIQNEENGYYVIGHSDVHGQDFLELSVLKIDQSGIQLWFRLYEANSNFYDYGKSIALSPNGTLAYCGVAKQNNSRKNNLYIVMFDPDGRELMDTYFNLEGSRWCTSIIADTDNNFVICGQSKTSGKINAWIMKIQNPLVAGIGLNNLDQSPEINCFPNPFCNQLNIKAMISHNEYGTCSIMDLNGKIIDYRSINEGSSPYWTWEFKCQPGNQTGAYYVVLNTNRKQNVRKVLMMH